MVNRTNVFSTAKKILRLPITLFELTNANIKILKNNKNYSLSEEKNKFRQVYDLICWSVKHQEANEYYYQYRMNIKGNNNQGYMSKNKFRLLRRASNTYYSCNRPIDYICLLSDKIMFADIMKGNVVVPRRFFFIRNGKINDSLELTIENIREKINGVDSFIIKDSFGQEAGLIGVDTGGVLLVECFEKEFVIKNKRYDEGDFIELLNNGTEWLAQEVIQQSREIEKLNPSSVNTVRLLTCIKNTEVEICKAVLKVGAKGEIVDNFWAGGILLHIDVEKGIFTGEYVYETSLRDENEVLDRINQLKNKKVKNWHSVVKQAKTAHRLIPRIRTIGWDIAILGNDACIVEGNDNWDIVMFQAFEPLNEYLTEMLS